MTSDSVANVLVVDDELELRSLLSDALSSDDISVQSASSAAEALELASRRRPDLLITDYHLGGDLNGLDVIDGLRKLGEDVPAVVITGYGDAGTLTEASRRRPIELMTKPLNLPRLRRTVREELGRLRRERSRGRWGDLPARYERLRQRTGQLRRVARGINHERKSVRCQLDRTCAGLTAAYRTLSGQLASQRTVMDYQHEMIAARDDDHVFASLFRLFVRRTGPMFGVALVCDEDAQLKVIGRFGVPKPDPLGFCQKLAMPVVDALLAGSRCLLLDAGDEADMFDESIRRRLPGVTILAVPLLPSAGELIGIALLYRKGEQPFTDDDISVAEMIGYPTAAAIQRND
jgi:CheY-like chemotaxis protein